MHTCTGEREEQDMRCNIDNGSYLAWSQWSECSTTCQGGNRFRSRQHTCGQDDQVEQGACGGTGQNMYTLWAQWSTCPS